MKHYLDSITPDSFSGILYACEGIRGGYVLLNGPTGCKFYHSAIADNQLLRPSVFERYNYADFYSFGQPRIPCTYLDNGDYVYGSADKLRAALSFLLENVSMKLLCVVNSPGAALIGDDLKGIVSLVPADIPVITIQTPGYSLDLAKGHEFAVKALIEALAPEKRTEEERDMDRAAGRFRVNLLGRSIFHKNHEGDIDEIRRMLELCGMEMNAAVCAGCSTEEFLQIGKADLNLVIEPEFGLSTAELLKERYGTPFYVCDGLPVGFDAAEKMMKDIDAIRQEMTENASHLDRFLQDAGMARGRAYAFISRMNQITGLPLGVPFAVEGSCSEILGYTRFLSGYMGMKPDGIMISEYNRELGESSLRTYLEQEEIGYLMGKDPDRMDPEIVLASGNTIARLKLEKKKFSGIETSLPTIGYYDVVPKTFLGIRGALLLIEMVLNGLDF